MTSTTEIIKRAVQYANRIALTSDNQEYTYQDLVQASQSLAQHLLGTQQDLMGQRVAFMAVKDPYYVIMQWAIWQAGGIAVPISLSHPLPEIEYILEDTQAILCLCTSEHRSFLSPLKKNPNFKIINVEGLSLEGSATRLPQVSSNRPALIVYTSGTTSKPKGVVTSHQVIEAQIKTLVEAWEWTSEDFILHVLPLHHVHGIINVLACALWSGAQVRMLKRFDAEKVWNLFTQEPFSLFMAVPTVYKRLIDQWESAPQASQEQMYAACQKMRLMVSGSAALPVSTLEKWQSISGHFLLERYGMTEIGMAISNPLHGQRKSGHIGLPLPGVEVRLVDENQEVITDAHTSGEIQIKSSSVFEYYWNRPEATAKSFVDGWFLTGDIAQRDEEGYYKILGRNSVDIIKTGGYKVSALEIEEVLLRHPLIKECAVVGIANADWGELVAVAISCPEQALSLEELRNWAKQYLAHYKVPSQMKIIKQLPRNVMGKVVKPEIKNFF